MTEAFSSEQGEVLPEGSFQIMTQEGKEGQSAFANFQPVKIGTTPLYTSNNKGNGDTVRLVYRLSVPKEARGGNYRVQLSFALSLI